MTHRRVALAVVAVLVAAGAVVLVRSGDGRGRLPSQAAVPAVERDDPVRFVSVGTDETDGAGLPDDPGDFRKRWTFLLYDRTLPRRTVFTDVSVSGSTAAGALAEQLPLATEFRPTVATVWLTSTDVAARTPLPDYERDLTTVVRRLQAAGARNVLLGEGAVLPDRASAPPYDAAVERVAAATGARLVDLRSVGFPLSVAGHEQVAAAFAAAVGPQGP